MTAATGLPLRQVATTPYRDTTQQPLPPKIPSSLFEWISGLFSSIKQAAPLAGRVAPHTDNSHSTKIEDAINGLQKGRLDFKSIEDAINGLQKGRLDFKSLSYDLRTNKLVALAAVSKNGLELEHVHVSLEKDQDIVFAAVSQNGCAIRYAHPIFDKDKNLAIAAVSQNGLALELVSQRLKQDLDVVIAAISQNAVALRYASIEVSKNKDVVIAAVSQNGRALYFASTALQNDREVVLAAVSQNGYALENASNALKNDREVVLAAVTQNGSALVFASDTFRNDREITSAAVAQNPKARRYVSPTILANANREITTYPVLLPFADPSLITYEIAQKAVKINYRLLQFIPPEMLADRPLDGNEDNDIISLALNANPEAINLIPWDLLTGTLLSYVIARHESRNKNELVRSLLKITRKMGEKSPEEIRPSHLDLAWAILPFFNNFKGVMLTLINKYGLQASDASHRLRQDPEILADSAQVAEEALARGLQAHLLVPR